MLKIKRLRESAIIPTRAHASDAGLDLYVMFPCIIESGELKVVRLGIAMEVPEGYEIQIRPRSGLSKKGIIAMLGTVDAGYRGDVAVALLNTTSDEYVVSPGDRIAQAIINKVELCNPVEVDELSDTDRGESGFGSSGV